MRLWQWGLVAFSVLGIGIAVYMLRPVEGPARDLSLASDAARGAYLIRLGGCVSCHTVADGGDLLAGGPQLATPFGTFVAPNITPHAEAGIGNWTLDQFAAALSNGDGPEGHLYPIFPYENYTLMSDQDVVDLYAALREVPPSDTAPAPHKVSFPFNIRLSLSGWKNLFFSPRRYEPDPTQSEAWNRGAYLANGPAHCVACHTPRNVLGALEAGQEFGGNPGGGPGGRTPPITAEALLAKGYDRATFIEALKTGFTPNFDVLGGAMGEVVADSTSYWIDADLEALATYVFGES